MDRILRRLRGIVGTAITWGAGWALVGAALSTIVGIVDPPAIDAGEGPLSIARIIGTVGLVIGAFFASVFTLAEGKRKSIAELSLLRATAWGMIGAAILPLATTMPNNVLFNTVPLGALSALGTVLLARRAARVERLASGRSPAGDLEDAARSVEAISSSSNLTTHAPDRPYAPVRTHDPD